MLYISQKLVALILPAELEDDAPKHQLDQGAALFKHLGPNCLQPGASTGEALCGGTGFCWVFGPQTGVQKNHFFRSLEGAKSLENLSGLRIAGEKAFGMYDVLDRKQSSLRINGQLLFSAV